MALIFGRERGAVFGTRGGGVHEDLGVPGKKRLALYPRTIPPSREIVVVTASKPAPADVQILNEN